VENKHKSAYYQHECRAQTNTPLLPQHHAVQGRNEHQPRHENGVFNGVPVPVAAEVQRLGVEAITVFRHEVGLRFPHRQVGEEVAEQDEWRRANLGAAHYYAQNHADQERLHGRKHGEYRCFPLP
nr:hypothetical protein [Tanacetum cinerariifolium]